ncbi:MAG: methyltransferase domain-containing protein [Flavobacteriales bacterium]
MKAEFWNERYKEEVFAYGMEANDFLQEQSIPMGSKILCLAEGEGRNGVYLAEQGNDVTCVDYSEEGVRKMSQLAEIKGVKLTTVCADLTDYTLGENLWDVIVIIFGHFPEDLRKKVHGQIFQALKPKGKLILEAYHKSQIAYKTGGPMTETMLYSEAELREDFQEFEMLTIRQVEREVHEGEFHFGKAAVIQVVAEK